MFWLRLAHLTISTQVPSIAYSVVPEERTDFFLEGGSGKYGYSENYLILKHFLKKDFEDYNRLEIPTVQCFPTRVRKLEPLEEDNVSGGGETKILEMLPRRTPRW